MRVTVFRTYSTIIEVEDHVIDAARDSGDPAPVIDAHLAFFPGLLPAEPGVELPQGREYYDEKGNPL